jgi:hypothetical protein
VTLAIETGLRKMQSYYYFVCYCLKLASFNGRCSLNGSIQEKEMLYIIYMVDTHGRVLRIYIWTAVGSLGLYRYIFLSVHKASIYSEKVEHKYIIGEGGAQIYNRRRHK